MAEDRKFEQSLEIDAPADAVWSALTDPEHVAQWFAPTVEIEPGEGGKVVWRWDNHHTWPQRIDRWEPGAFLGTRYDSQVEDGDGGKQPLFMDFALSGEGGKTTLRLVHHGFGPDASFDEELDAISGGWPVELQSLRLYCERHHGKKREIAWSRGALDMPKAEAFARLVGPGGFDCGDLASSPVGARFALDTPSGGRFEGTTLCCSRTQFSGIAENFGSAFIRLSVEEWAGQSHVWLWLAAYDIPRERLDEVETRWDTMVRTLFPEIVPESTQG